MGDRHRECWVVFFSFVCQGRSSTRQAVSMGLETEAGCCVLIDGWVYKRIIGKGP